MLTRRLIPPLALALLVLITGSTVVWADDNPLAGFIDVPQVGVPVQAGQPFTVRGWLVDQTAQGWAGIDAITVSLQLPGHDAIPLGDARIAQPRPDVGDALGNPYWVASGYSIDASGLPAGAYTLTVNAHTGRGWVSRTQAFSVAGPGSGPSVPVGASSRWNGYGFTAIAPSSMWPMLELLHRLQFDWELASLGQRPTPLVWAELPAGLLGSYMPADNVIKLSTALLSSSVEARTAILAHEVTHLNDDLDHRFGNLNDVTGDACYQAETRAFVNEANFWQMLWGPEGKQPTDDPIEAQENRKMWAFVGNAPFADLVVRTTPSYVAECGQG
jgi:hypothetical protein